MYVNVIQDIYKGASTRTKRMCGETGDFNFKERVYQNSALSTYLFSLIIKESIKNILSEVTLYMVFANDVVLVEESYENLSEHE